MAIRTVGSSGNPSPATAQTFYPVKAPEHGLDLSLLSWSLGTLTAWKLKLLSHNVKVSPGSDQTLSFPYYLLLDASLGLF